MIATVELGVLGELLVAVVGGFAGGTLSWYVGHIVGGRRSRWT